MSQFLIAGKKASRWRTYIAALHWIILLSWALVEFNCVQTSLSNVCGFTHSSSWKQETNLALELGGSLSFLVMEQNWKTHAISINTLGLTKKWNPITYFCQSLLARVACVGINFLFVTSLKISLENWFQINQTITSICFSITWINIFHKFFVVSWQKAWSWVKLDIHSG